MPIGGRPGGPPPGGGRPMMPTARRDKTEKDEKVVYYSQLNFDEARNDYTLTKALIGSLVGIIIYSLACFFVPLSFNFWIIDFFFIGFWLLYFITGIVKFPLMVTLPYKEKVNYWTYERTSEYKNRNVALNDFKKEIANSLIDRTTYIDDVSVELVSYNPLKFDFSVQSTRATHDTVKRVVPTWGSKFQCMNGTVTVKGPVSYSVVYPRKGMWEVLAGRNISQNDAIGDTTDPGINSNPIGVCTTSMEEITLNNADLHTMITGGTGCGKSNMFNMILYNLFHTNAVIVFYDGKGGVEVFAMRDRCWPVTSTAQAEAWAYAIRRELQRRMAALQERGGYKKFASPEVAAKDSDAMPFSDEFPPLVLAIDENREWVNKSGSAADTKFSQNMKQFESYVATQGRAAGITLMVATQVPRDNAIPQDVRAMCNQKIAFKQTPDYESNGIERSNEDPKPSQIPPVPDGVGQFCFSSGKTDGHAIPVKGYFVSSKKIQEAAAKYSKMKRNDYTVVGEAYLYYKKLQEKDPSLPPFDSTNGS